MEPATGVRHGNGFKDLTGAVCGRLTVVRYDSRVGAGKDHWWLCRCECGAEPKVKGVLLRAGRSRSCGCLYRESRGKAQTTHGLSGTPEHVVWSGMLGRCRNPSNTLYHKYGAKGVVVCERWHSFEAFLEDMGARPSPLHSVERDDNGKGYEPGNCRWATRREQARNRSTVRLWEHGGESLPMTEWARRVGLKYTTLRNRVVYHGWDFKRALETPA